METQGFQWLENNVLLTMNILYIYTHTHTHTHNYFI